MSTTLLVLFSRILILSSSPTREACCRWLLYPLTLRTSYIPVMWWLMVTRVHCRIGAGLIGMVVSILLLGITYTQTFYYYTSASKLWVTRYIDNSIRLVSADYLRDSWRLKSLVRTLMSCESPWLFIMFSFIPGGLHHSIQHCSPSGGLILRCFKWIANMLLLILAVLANVQRIITWFPITSPPPPWIPLKSALQQFHSNLPSLALLSWWVTKILNDFDPA